MTDMVKPRPIINYLPVKSVFLVAKFSTFQSRALQRTTEYGIFVKCTKDSNLDQ